MKSVYLCDCTAHVVSCDYETAKTVVPENGSSKSHITDTNEAGVK